MNSIRTMCDLGFDAGVYDYEITWCYKTVDWSENARPEFRQAYELAYHAGWLYGQQCDNINK